VHHVAYLCSSHALSVDHARVGKAHFDELVKTVAVAGI
jgi:hypothetical protein